MDEELLALDNRKVYDIRSRRLAHEESTADALYYPLFHHGTVSPNTITKLSTRVTCRRKLLIVYVKLGYTTILSSSFECVPSIVFFCFVNHNSWVCDQRIVVFLRSSDFFFLCFDITITFLFIYISSFIEEIMWFVKKLNKTFSFKL